MTDSAPIDASLLPPRQLFRFSCDLRHCKKLWTAKGAALGEEYRLPDLGTLEGHTPWADVRMAWNAEGLAWRVQVDGKSQAPWCRESRLDESDG
ncbi:hypothetical protein OAS39_09140, partial [Pirellulales bacterium]|nr:hypothetical protein [Pirellulales bacterium]